MSYRLITAVCKADVNLKRALFPGNFKKIPQVQPKPLELRRCLSQLSSHQPKGFDKPFNQKNGNKCGVCTAGGIGADRKSSSMSCGADGREGDEEKSKLGPGSDGTNKRKILSGIEGNLGVCWQVYLNHKKLNWNGFVEKVLGHRTHLAQLVNAAKSNDPQIQDDAVNSLRKLFTSGRNPPIDFPISCNILPKLVDDLGSQNPALQIDALWALTELVAGTSEQAQAVVDAGAVPHFLRLLTSPNQIVQEFALAALTGLIAKWPQLGDCVINLEVVASLLNCIQADTTGNFLHEVSYITTWLLSKLNDGGNGKKQIHVVIDSGVLPKLVQLLNHGKVKVQEPALIVVGNIFVDGNNNQVQAVLNCEALSFFHNLLNHPKENICEMALLALSNVAARSAHQVQAVIDAGLIPLMIHLLEKGEFQTQKAAALALGAMTVSGKKEQVAHLIDCGVIPPLCNLWNSKDSEVVQIALEGIHNILAELFVNWGDGHKAWTLIQECGGWDKMVTQKHETIAIRKITHDINRMQMKFLGEQVRKIKEDFKIISIKHQRNSTEFNRIRNLIELNRKSKTA